MSLDANPIRRLRVLALLGDGLDARGGIAQYNRDWLEAARARPGMQFRIVSYSRAASNPSGVPEIRHARTRPTFLAACIAALGFRPDVVFCGHLHLAPVAAMVSRLARARLWVQVHGIEAWEQPSRVRRVAVERADLLTSVSRFTARRVRAWCRMQPSRVRVLPDTFDEARFAAGEAHVSPPILLTVARLAAAEAYKGHDRVIGLMPRLRESHPGITYRIVGDGDDRPRLERLAMKLAVEDIVHFVPQVDRDALPEEMRRASVFVMPSTGEGFGIAFLEAMACGTPAVGLDQDGSVDALGAGDLGTCARIDSLHDAIVRALDESPPANLADRTRLRFGRAPFVDHVSRLFDALASDPEASSR